MKMRNVCYGFEGMVKEKVERKLVDKTKSFADNIQGNFLFLYSIINGVSVGLMRSFEKEVSQAGLLFLCLFLFGFCLLSRLFGQKKMETDKFCSFQEESGLGCLDYGMYHISTYFK
ncbi:hypothetical protein VNO77_21263 [Canavalia gladiata]|uniref:Uncharacterized protein n=1 Tax=Canavalia gladiata TaxID=3824 RepID=A0AAN9LQZ3_CANGL